MRPGGVSGGAAARADAVCSQAAEGSSFLKMVLLFCLVFGAIMASIVAKRERAERALRKVHDELERRVAERTAGLTKAHGQLKKSIEERRHHFFFKHRLASDDIREVEVFSCLIDYGKNQLLYSIVSDITERKRAEEEIQRQNQELLRLSERQLRINADLLEETASLEEANASVSEIAATDDLTGLANRRTFREHMVKAVSMAQRHGAALALVSLDLDGLKRVNDSAGHAAGDEVLVLFAEHLASVCRAEDVSARLGGDEFSVLLPGIDVNGARGLAERVLEGVRSCEVLRQRGITVSAGVTAWKTNDLPDDLLRRADEALYAAKHCGGNAVAGGE